MDAGNVMFSIRKPFDKLLFSKGCKTWYSVLSEYRANNIKEIDELYRLIESLSFQLQLEQAI